MIFAILLAILGSGPGQASRTRVDVCEVNEFALPDGSSFRQVILWRWYRGGEWHGHRVAQWWRCNEEPLITWENGTRVIRHRGLEFEASAIRRTRTRFDPERRDRSILPEDHRRPFLPCPELGIVYRAGL